MPVQVFRIPHNIPLSARVSFCLKRLDQYRAEVVPLRRKVLGLTQSQNNQVRRYKELFEKYRDEKLRRKELEKENEELKKEVEKLTKTNNRYQISLFDHGNFSHKKAEDKKEKGGQLGHSDTNREARENIDFKARKVFYQSCPCCGEPLGRVNSFKQKQFIDIKLYPEVIKLFLQSERQWCGNCKKEQLSKYQDSLPFTEYGLNILMMVLILRYRCLLPLSKISLVIEVIGGITLPKSTVNNLLNQTKKYLKSRYDELTKAVRKGEIMYADETGWTVRGNKAWVWITTNEKITVYKAAESRGKGIFEEIRGNSSNYCMHDGYGAYIKTIDQNKQMYCWSHLLRFAFEETHDKKNNKDGIKIRDKLVDTYRLINQRHQYKTNQLKQLLNDNFESVLKINSKEGSVGNIQHRVKTQKTGLINAILYSPDGTNNLAERELRSMVILRKNTFGSDTFLGMERDAILASVVQTTHRQELPLLPNLKQQLQTGLTQLNPNYCFGRS